MPTQVNLICFTVTMGSNLTTHIDGIDDVLKIRRPIISPTFMKFLPIVLQERSIVSHEGMYVSFNLCSYDVL